METTAETGFTLCGLYDRQLCGDIPNGRQGVRAGPLAEDLATAVAVFFWMLSMCELFETQRPAYNKSDVLSTVRRELQARRQLKNCLR